MPKIACFYGLVDLASMLLQYTIATSSRSGRNKLKLRLNTYKLSDIKVDEMDNSVNIIRTVTKIKLRLIFKEIVFLFRILC